MFGAFLSPVPDQQMFTPLMNPIQSRPFSARFLLVLLAISLAFIMFVRLYTPAGGVITVGDSVSYVAAMRSFQAGADMVRHDGSPYIFWPPLYPVLMAVSTQVGSLFGLDLFGSIQYLNYLTATGSIVMLGLLARRSFQSQLLAVCAVLAVAFSWPFFVLHIEAWSEPVYVLLILAFLYVFTDFLRQGGGWRFVLCIGLAALLNLQRYASMTLVAAVCLTLVLFLRRAAWFRRLQLALVFGLFSMFPIGLWYWRNYQISGGIAGVRSSPGIPLNRILEDLFAVIGAWLTPPAFEPKWIVGAFVLVVMACVWVFLKRRHVTRDSLLPAGAFYGLFSVPYILIYFAFFTYTATRQTVTLDDRNMIHVFVLTFLLLFMGVDALLARRVDPPTPRQRQVIYGAAVGLALIWLMMVRSPKLVSEYAILSRGCCRDYTWDGSEFVAWLSENRLTGELWTNDVYRASLYGGIYPRQLPRTIQADWAAQWVRDLDDESYLIWFGSDHRVDFELVELEAVVSLDPVQEYENGAVFQIRPAQ